MLAAVSTRQNVLIQRFVKESKGRDIRALVVGDRPDSLVDDIAALCACLPDIGGLLVGARQLPKRLDGPFAPFGVRSIRIRQARVLSLFLLAFAAQRHNDDGYAEVPNLLHRVFRSLRRRDHDVGLKVSDLLDIPFGQPARRWQVLDPREDVGHVVAKIGLPLALDAHDFVLRPKLSKHIEGMMLQHDHSLDGNAHRHVVVSLVLERPFLLHRLGRFAPLRFPFGRIVRRTSEHAGHRSAADPDGGSFHETTARKRA